MGFRKIITGIVGLIVIAITGWGIFTATPLYAQFAPCELVNNQERMLVFFAPVYAGSQIKDILPQGAPYTMIGENDGYFFIEYADGERGWIDFHTRILNGRCIEQTFILPDDASHTLFPTLCFYTTTEMQEGYQNPELTDSHPGHQTVGTRTYTIVAWNEQALELAGSGAMSGAWIERGDGTFSGHCDGTLQLARVGDNARLWTAPDVTTGEMMLSLEAESEVSVLEDPVLGIVVAESSLQGSWYRINYRGSMGWIWEDRLTFGRTFTTPQPVTARATALADARVWSQPDITTGAVITTLLEDSEVNVIGQPVEGIIHQDTGALGIWYPVQQGGTTGWVYGERLEIIDGKG